MPKGQQGTEIRGVEKQNEAAKSKETLVITGLSNESFNLQPARVEVFLRMIKRQMTIV